MQTFACDVVVVGAGVVGLAVARAFGLAGREVLVVDAEHSIGAVTSSRNSEVIHSGIYYPPGSLKAELCVAGRAALYAYCADRNVPHRACGKLVVAADAADSETLAALVQNGRRNGVDGLVVVDGAALRALEPELVGHSALLCPVTGIVDSHALMQALHADIDALGGAVCLATPVLDGSTEPQLALRIGGAEPALIEPRVLVNAAGLAAPDLVKGLRGFPAAHTPTAFYAKGNYYALAGRAPFSRLVYPLPEPGGLGVHATVDLAGRVRFGPDVEWVDNVGDYTVDAARSASFYRAIRRYWPGLPDNALQPAYSGIRPKLAGPDSPAADFVVQDEATHGVPGLINLLGIESPGLTASLALGAYVADRVAALAV